MGRRIGEAADPARGAPRSGARGGAGRRRLKYRLAQASIRAASGILLGYRVEGLEHVPREGAVLICANHTSYLDPPLLGAALPREIRYFAKKELFRVPLIGPLARIYGAIPIDREAFDRRGVSLALEALARGEGLLVFPEGTRIRRPGLAEPREGIALLAVRSGAPVVPAYLESTWEPRRSALRRIPVRIRFGPALRFPSLPPGPAARARYPEIAREVMEAIERLAPRDSTRRSGAE